MSGALAVIDGPDLFGTAPSDLVPDVAEFADATTARQRAERIRAHIVSYHQMRQDIADAFAYRDWAALGYSSWYGYLEGEFGPELHQLARSRHERRQVAADLRAGGLSTRQIGSLTGVDAKTVRNDLAGASAPDAVLGADGKTYPASRRPQAAAGTPTALPAAGIEDAAGPVPLAADPPASAGTDRPGPPSDPAAGQDLEQEANSGERVPSAVATPGQLQIGVDYERDPAKRIAAVAAVAPAFVQPAAPAERHAQITASLGNLALAVANLRELLHDASDVPLFALRQQRDDLDRLIKHLEAATALGRTES